jgi:hypothetical protein
MMEDFIKIVMGHDIDSSRRTLSVTLKNMAKKSNSKPDGGLFKRPMWKFCQQMNDWKGRVSFQCSLGLYNNR